VRAALTAGLTVAGLEVEGLAGEEIEASFLTTGLGLVPLAWGLAAFTFEGTLVEVGLVGLTFVGCLAEFS
jgi:hypothetical protein